jgi:hypothetical protein
MTATADTPDPQDLVGQLHEAAERCGNGPGSYADHAELGALFAAHWELFCELAGEAAARRANRRHAAQRRDARRREARRGSRSRRPA